MADRVHEGTVPGRSGIPPFVAATAAPPRQHGALHQPHVDSPPLGPDFARCSELECIRHLLAGRLIAAAERRAAEIGVGADRVLITAGAISEEDYLRAFSARLGLPFECFENVPRQCCPLTDDRLIDAAAAGLLPLRAADGIVWVVAPRGIAARRLSDFVDLQPKLTTRLRITTAERLSNYVAHHAAGALGARAANALKRAWPPLSAAPRRWRPPIVPVAAFAALILTALILSPRLTIAAFDAALAVVFIAWMALRMFGTLVRPTAPAPSALTSDFQLPIYTIVAALYREAAAVEGLAKAIRELDYPPEKLDVKLVLEADDKETLAAVKRLAFAAPLEIIIAPTAGPRTKPKALNAALPFARGTFTVVYDAEDRPEPDQLRRALDTFLCHNEKLACVQAALTIDNTGDGWIARMYTAEYAGQFDVLLPGLSALNLPLPLGGSSNHFRTDVLRQVGAWDPYNVTEDADLGMRLCRFGYRATAIASTTYEEAPAAFGPWLRQRTRWYKGWMQTWLVHMRNPALLLYQLGPAGFATFQLVVGGNALAALIHPIFIATFAYGILAGIPVFSTESVAVVLLAGLHGTALVTGYLASIILGLLGLAHRRLLATGYVLLLTPLHWLMLSLAAWRALWQLARDPYRWEKTEHGLARTSRRANMRGGR